MTIPLVDMQTVEYTCTIYTVYVHFYTVYIHLCTIYLFICNVVKM